MLKLFIKNTTINLLLENFPVDSQLCKSVGTSLSKILVNYFTSMHHPREKRQTSSVHQRRKSERIRRAKGERTGRAEG